METICQAVYQNNTFGFQKPSPETVPPVINSPDGFSQLSDRVSRRIFEAILEEEFEFQHQLLLWSRCCFLMCLRLYSKCDIITVVNVIYERVNAAL